jgi:hypothetical protein
MPTEDEKKWIAAWRNAGPELERIRRQELRDLSDEEGTRQAMLLGVATVLIKPRATSIGRLSELLAKQKT